MDGNVAKHLSGGVHEDALVCLEWDAAPCVEVGRVSLCASTLGDVNTSFKTDTV